MAVMTDAIRTLKLLGCEVLFWHQCAGSFLRPGSGVGYSVALSDQALIRCPVRRWWGQTMIVMAIASSLANAYDADYRAMLQSVAAERIPLTEGWGVFVSYPVRTSKRRQKLHDADYWRRRRNVRCP